MPFSFDPNSYKLTASASNWHSYLEALGTHITNNSTRWSVDDDAGSSAADSDFGILLSPDAQGEDFELALRHDDSVDTSTGNADDDRLYAALDPDAAITDPIDPTASGTGSSQASGERTWAGDSDSNGLGWDSEFLVAEYDDALILIFKNGGSVPWVIQIGRILYPIFANDPANGIDGLGWVGAPPRFVDNTFGNRMLFKGNNNDETGNEIRAGSSNWRMASAKAETGIGGPNFWDEYNITTSYTGAGRDTPVAISVRDFDSSSTRKTIGTCKYLYLWTNENILTRLDGGGGEGLLVVNNGNKASMVVPWDPGVTP